MRCQRPRSCRALAAGIACALALLSSCSTAPTKTETVSTVKTQAAQASSFGDAYFKQGRYDLALQFFTQALDYNTSVDNGEGVIQSYDAIAKVYMATGDLGTAEDIFTRARELARSSKKSLFFVSSNSLGELYLARGEPQKSLAIFEEALAMPEEARTAAQLGILYHNLGTTHKNLGDPAKALEYYGKSLKINLANKLIEEAASDYYMIASVNSKQGDYEQAARNADLALAYDKQIENSQGIAKDLYALGLIATRRKDTASAYDYFQRAYLVFTTLGQKSEMKKSLTSLIASAESLGKAAEVQSYRKALTELDAQ
jgi:tetratricopeptide (TPR) repeat protein